MIMSIAATAQSTCSSFSTPTGPGAVGRLPTSGQLATLLSACASWSTSTIRKPSRSGSCWTIYRRILPARSMKPSRHPRRTAYCAAWSSTTPQSMPAGSTWSRSRSACCAASASTAASARATASSPKLPPGNSSATPPAPASPGCSQPSALAPKWPALTPTLPKCHNPCAEVLDGAVALFEHANHYPPQAQVVAETGGVSIHMSKLLDQIQLSPGPQGTGQLDALTRRNNGVILAVDQKHRASQPRQLTALQIKATQFLLHCS